MTRMKIDSQAKRRNALELATCNGRCSPESRNNTRDTDSEIVMCPIPILKYRCDGMSQARKCPYWRITTLSALTTQHLMWRFQTSSPWTVMPSWLQNAYSRPIFRPAILTRKVPHTDLVFGVRSDSLVGLCMWDYKSLYAAVTICDNLVNIQTHIPTQKQHLTRLYEKLSQLN